MEIVPTFKNDVKRIELQVDTNEVSWIVFMLKKLNSFIVTQPPPLRRRQWFGQGDGDEEI